MNILSNAIKEYANGNYAYALSLFQKAGEVFGEHIVRYHIEKCESELKKNPSLKVSALSPSVSSPENIIKNELDLATKILLSNVAKLDLADKKEQLIAEWKQLTSKKSLDAEIKKVNPIPADFPKDLTLAPLPDGVNDFEWNKRRKNITKNISTPLNNIGLSVIIPTFNRSWILDITLSCLCNQKTQYPFEVIVADDGSKEDISLIIRKYEDKLDIKYVRQRDYGYQLCAVRNLGLRTAKYPYVSILDCDMAPNPKWVQSYVELLLEDDDVALIGPRKYVDTHNITPEQIRENATLIENLPEVRTNNNVAGKAEGEISVDWRLEHFKKTENLRLCDSPFRFFSGGNVAFAKKWLDKAGWFDEEFTHWGGEDNEFGYRLFKQGCFFRAVDGGMAYHQEPPGKENETDRDEGKKITLNIVKKKVPYVYRKPLDIAESHIHRVPLVTIYIPAYNCASYIQRCVDSALNQTITDLEVCICNDGSTDNTLEVLQALYGDNPRVRILNQKNGGIASASNTAVKNANGYYIAQLDSDDYLEPDAVELCLKEFLRDRSLACVYTTNRNVNSDGSLIANGYNWSEFSREKLTTAMIVHHFRMFTARAWNLTSGFDEKIENSVDYDMYLKLSEVGKFKHINKICYNRVLHGNNTSIQKLGIQKKNHFLVVNASLARQGLTYYSYDPMDDKDDSRKYIFTKKAEYEFVNTQEIQKTSISEKKNIAVSIFYPSKLDGLIAKLENISEYNKNITAVVLHINKNYASPNTLKSIEEFTAKTNIKVILNSDIGYENFKYRQMEYHLSNFQKLTDDTIDYFMIDNFDSMYVLKDAYTHMQKYDIGINLGDISGYWKDIILAHKSLNDFVNTHLGKTLSSLRIKGTSQGLFMQYTLAKELFLLIEELLKQCTSNKDMPKYLAEEIWFALALTILESKQNKSYKKTGTLTYMPWERKLQWTKEQIEEAKQGIGISKGRFLINRVEMLR